MPNCGSQILMCNLPIRFDTYKGCSHHCKYCFVYRKYNIEDIKKYETKESLINFINGKRLKETEWCDWNIPLHWGGVSDPFQPCERKFKNSLECLKVFAETKYPFIVSTKAILPIEEPYFSLFKECNCVFQVSAVCPTLARLYEQGASSFEDRIDMIRKISKVVKRVVVRCQPYVLELHDEIKKQIPIIAEAGAYGITYEAMKMQKKVKGMERNGADYVYPKQILEKKWLELKDECHKYGLVFLSSENRLRHLGDSLTCCGCDGLDGFQVNHSNLNYKIHKPEDFYYTKGQCEGCAMCYKALYQRTAFVNILKNKTFKEINEEHLNNPKIVKNYLDIK